jgi:hypothetical protein
MVFNTNSNYGNGSGLYINMGTSVAPDWMQLVPNTTSTFIRNQTGQQAGSNFNISGNGKIGNMLTVKQIGVNISPTSNFRLQVNGSTWTNTLSAQEVTSSQILGATISALQYFDMSVKYNSHQYNASGNGRTSFKLGCPNGYQLLSGGGGHRDLNSAASDIKINYSGPDPDNPSKTWKLIVTNTSSSSRAILM